jgi:hypothetical protein
MVFQLLISPKLHRSLYVISSKSFSVICASFSVAVLPIHCFEALRHYNDTDRPFEFSFYRVAGRYVFSSLLSDALSISLSLRALQVRQSHNTLA